MSSEERNQRVTRPRHTYRGYTPAIRYSPCMCIRGQAGRGGTLQELTVNSWSRDTRPARSGFPNLGWTSRAGDALRAGGRRERTFGFRTIRGLIRRFVYE